MFYFSKISANILNDVRDDALLIPWDEHEDVHFVFCLKLLVFTKSADTILLLFTIISNGVVAKKKNWQWLYMFLMFNDF